ncbi:MAG: GtrA family protein [Patescibacteria group bacterium]
MKKFIRFILGGNLGALVGYGIFILLTELGVWYITSSFIGEIVIDLTNFSIYKFWTFEERNKKRTKMELLLYSVVAIIYWVMNAGLMYFFTEHCNQKYWVSKTLAVIVLAYPSFWVMDKKVFKNGE